MAIGNGVKSMMEFVRGKTLETVGQLTHEQWLREPDAFSNNVLWNAGHILVVQAHMVYVHNGKESPLPPDYERWFGSGTTPGTWERVPDVDEVMTQLKSFNQTIFADNSKGRFRKVKPLDFAGSVRLASLDDILTQATIHESIHLGIIMSIEKLV